MNKDEIKLARLTLRNEREISLQREIFGFIKNPIVILIAGFLAIDYMEAHSWKDQYGNPTGNTMIGPLAGGTLRTALVSAEVLKAIGDSGIADAVATMSKSGAEAAGALAPLLALVK